VPNRTLLRWTGSALAIGGVLTFLVNACLTPLLPRATSFAQTVASPIFPWRQGMAAVAATLLIFGSLGLYLRQMERVGWFGAGAFVVSLLGSALVLATEWVQLFAVRDFALRAPEALTKLQAGPGLTLFDLGAIIAVAFFALGWIAMAVVTLRARVLSRPAALLVIAGFFAIPLLQPVMPGVWGAIVSNAILGAGWCWLGCEVSVSAP
jgi:hypothetical protein